MALVYSAVGYRDPVNDATHGAAAVALAPVHGAAIVASAAHHSAHQTAHYVASGGRVRRGYGGDATIGGGYSGGYGDDSDAGFGGNIGGIGASVSGFPGSGGADSGFGINGGSSFDTYGDSY